MIIFLKVPRERLVLGTLFCVLINSSKKLNTYKTAKKYHILSNRPHQPCQHQHILGKILKNQQLQKSGTQSADEEKLAGRDQSSRFCPHIALEIAGKLETNGPGKGRREN